MRIPPPLRVGLSALALLCACHEQPLPPRADVSPEPLPELFGPVGWASTQAQLRARFPEARVTQDDFDTPAPEAQGRFHLDGARLAPFGEARIRLLRRGGAPTGVLVVEHLDDAGATCPLEVHEAYRACADRLERERLAVLGTLMKTLQQRYGPPSVDFHFGSDEVEGRDPRQFSWRWERPGYTLELGTGQEPSGHAAWTVRLVAIRDLDYPFL